jgi:integrating conjugative element protein (TIGR03746 family)
MSSGFKTIVDQQTAHIWTLRVMLGASLILLFLFWYGWQSAPDRIEVHVPPSLTDGAVLPIHTVPEPNVYAFANHIFQQLQRWPKDGNKDYQQNIYSLQYFLTPRYQDALTEDYQRKYSRGELKGTQRYGQVVAGHVYEDNRVDHIGHHAWIVYLDYEITELVGGMRTKQVEIRYPIRVVRYDIDREKNRWGLALDGYPPGLNPRRLDDIRAEELAMH